ncbi:MAG: polysaccharide deacetylase family protein [Acidobacteria bacterium]|nr:polysaccharide deacetylase family protein [Acidobacteriota bacterium]
MLFEVTGAIAAAVVLGHGVRGRSSRLFGPNVWRGPRDKRQIALTFDDGPSEATEQVLEVLDLFCVRATFFQCGKNVERRPALARQVHEQGHEIGNHTYSHPRLMACSPARIREEIGNTQKAIADATGAAPRWFRAPYGERWFGLRAALREHGLTGVMWTVMGNDWDWEAAEIAHHVVGHASNGGIVCLHDGDRVAERADRRNTVQALRDLIPRLYGRGFSFVTLGELLQSGAKGGVQ